MRSLYSLMKLAVCLLIATTAHAAANLSQTSECRSQPGDASFPTAQDFSDFNSSVDGRLIKIVPSAQFCRDLPGGCTDAIWSNFIFGGGVPGAMLQINWEQDYASNPPSLCFRNTTACGQGSVPLYGVNATTAAHIQASIRFAQRHSLRVAVKASGHDYLGRSTAKNSFLLWTHQFQNITFHDSFSVRGKDQGSAVTVSSGVGLHALYQATKAQGKIFVGGTAATVVAAGGYVQGAGHSALGPLLGLAADNVLEFQIVVADGRLITVNEDSHPDLFWALRGGGAGSWGVLISATFRTFPTFDLVTHQATIKLNSSAAVGRLATLHAQHIFDWDSLRVGQYFYLTSTGSGFTMTLTSLIPNTSISAANATLAPFLDAAAAQGFSVRVVLVNSSVANDVLSSSSIDVGGRELVMGSRLIPADIYRYNATAIGEAYKELLDAGVPSILGHLVAGGQVSKNAGINSAINPKWRTAKTHVIILADWLDSTSPTNVEAIREDLTNNKVPILARLAGGPGSGSYSNEGDVREPDFQTTFFGPNYSRLSGVKALYDPLDLFIVGAGVGSERWDAEGLCRVGGCMVW